MVKPTAVNGLSPLEALHIGQTRQLRVPGEVWPASPTPQLVPANPRLQFARDLNQLRSFMLHSFPDLAKQNDPSCLALRLQALVAANVEWSETSPGTNFEDIVPLVYEALVARRATHVCGGITLIYLILAIAFGLKARFVGMFEAVENVAPGQESHCACEVWIDGRWRAMEPTYDVSFQSVLGKPIGWAQVRSILRRGGKVWAVPGPGAKRRSARFNSHQQKLPTLTRHLYLAPCGEGTKARWVGWKGQLTYASGVRLDYREQVNSGIYRLLQA